MTARTVRALLAYIAVLMLGAALVLVLRVNIPQAARDVVMVIIGALITLSKEAYSFFFGTSQSSHEKTEAMVAMQADNQPNPDHREPMA